MSGSLLKISEAYNDDCSCGINVSVGRGVCNLRPPHLINVVAKSIASRSAVVRSTFQDLMCRVEYTTHNNLLESKSYHFTNLSNRIGK